MTSQAPRDKRLPPPRSQTEVLNTCCLQVHPALRHRCNEVPLKSTSSRDEAGVRRGRHSRSFVASGAPSVALSTDDTGQECNRDAAWAQSPETLMSLFNRTDHTTVPSTSHIAVTADRCSGRPTERSSPNRSAQVQTLACRVGLHGWKVSYCPRALPTIYSLVALKPGMTGEIQTSAKGVSTGLNIGSYSLVPVMFVGILSSCFHAEEL